MLSGSNFQKYLTILFYSHATLQNRHNYDSHFREEEEERHLLKSSDLTMAPLMRRVCELCWGIWQIFVIHT